jgi:hypothetical protein
MRRIYDSEALAADEEDPFKPNRDEEDDSGPRTVDWANASHALVPMALRRRAVSVAVETDRESYPRDEPVRFRARFRNRLPIPVSLPTPTRVPWSWSVDGLEHASRVAVDNGDDDGLFRFARSEHKTFHRRWHQRFRESDEEWSTASPGDYRLRVWVSGYPETLAAETTVGVE